MRILLIMIIDFLIPYPKQVGTVSSFICKFRLQDLVHNSNFYVDCAAASEIPSTPLSQVREQVTNLCINILHSYRKFCATVSSSGQLILPEALKLLPLYTLGISLAASDSW